MTAHSRLFVATVALFSSACLTPVNQIDLGSLDSGSGGGSATGGGSTATGGGGGATGGGATGGGGVIPDQTDGGLLVPLDCRAGEWCWQHPIPQGQALNSVFVISDTEAWAVGDRGAMQRRQNGTWTAMRPVTDFSLHQLAGTGTNDVWAIGRKSTGFSTPDTFQLLHFDGTRWSVIPHGALPSVRDVTASASGETWVLTDADTTDVSSQVLRWNGTALVPVAAFPTSPEGLEAQSICVRSATEAWATVNDDLNSFPIALYRFDGTSWSLVHRTTAGSSRRFDSRVTCPDDGVAVVQLFEFNTASYSFLEVRGSQVTFTAAPTYGNLVRSAHGDAFSVNGRLVARWTPSGWDPMFSLANDESVFGVEFDFAGPIGLLAKSKPVLSTFNGFSFTPDTELPASLNAFVAPPGVNPQDPIAVFGDGTWAQRNGSTWTFAATPGALRVQRAFALPGGNAWLVGSAIAKYDATAQTISPTSVSGDFVAIDGVSGDESTLWAVGDDAIVRRYDGAQWVAPAVAPPIVVDGLTLGSLAFSAVDVRAANDVMLLGNDPAGGQFVSVFYKWDGATWTTALTSGPTLELFDRDTAGDLYVVEGSEVKKRAWTSTTWTTVGSIPGSAQRLRVYGPDDVEVVVRTGEGMGLYRFDIDRQAFTLEDVELKFSGATGIVPGGLINGRATYWASGNSGSILRFAP